MALACRRTTFEWVLRKAALAAPGVALLDGVVVDGLAATDDPSGLRRATGVHLADGRTIDGDLVVLAGGRRGDVPAWFAAIGATPVPEEDEDTGIVYWSRFYRLLGDAPTTEGPIGADLGYLKFAVFPGDNGTFSVTLATPNDDAPMRSLSAPGHFDVAAAALQPVAPWVAPGVSEPITEVHPMARLRNRLRTLRDRRPTGRPRRAGGRRRPHVHQPALRPRVLARDGARRAAGRRARRARHDRRGLPPRLRGGDGARSCCPGTGRRCNQDRMQRAEAARLLAEADGTAPLRRRRRDDPEAVQRQFMRSVLREGLFPAIRTDADRVPGVPPRDEPARVARRAPRGRRGDGEGPRGLPGQGRAGTGAAARPGPRRAARAHGTPPDPSSDAIRRPVHRPPVPRSPESCRLPPRLGRSQTSAAVARWARSFAAMSSGSVGFER